MFVVIEGANGSGKTSIINKFSGAGVNTLFSPGSTELSSYLRPLCRGTDQWEGVDKNMQFLAFSLARVDEYLRLVKDRDELIVTDRWWISTKIYQCDIEGFDEEFLKYTIHPDEKIDKVYILTGEDEVLANRISSERDANPDHKLCKWTADRKLLSKINGLYINELPVFLSANHIEYKIIDTTHINLDDVYNLIKMDLKLI